MEFIQSTENMSSDAKVCFRSISTIKLNYDHNEANDNKRFTCYLTTPSPMDSVRLPSKDMSFSSRQITRNSCILNRADEINSCLKELKKLKIIMTDLQKQIQSKNNENKSKSKTLKKLKETSAKNDGKISKIESTIEKHQEKIIRIEGLMHELDYDQLSSVKESDILGSFLLKNSSMLTKLKISQNTNLSSSISPKYRKINEKYKTRATKK